MLNLELRWCCYDLTSTYFETDQGDPNGKFASKRYGYSRDKRRDRPQVMTGLLVTGDGIPIARVRGQHPRRHDDADRPRRLAVPDRGQPHRAGRGSWPDLR